MCKYLQNLWSFRYIQRKVVSNHLHRHINAKVEIKIQSHYHLKKALALPDQESYDNQDEWLLEYLQAGAELHKSSEENYDEDYDDDPDFMPNNENSDDSENIAGY